MSDSPIHENEEDYDDEEMEEEEEQAEVYEDDAAMVEDEENTSSDESLLEPENHASDAMGALETALESPSASLRNNNAYTQETVEADYDEQEDDDEDDDVSKDQDNDENEVLEEGADHAKGRVADEGVEETNDDTSLEEGEEDNEEKLEPTGESKEDSAPTIKSQKLETTYSTRGRTQEENHLDRLAAVGDLLALGGNRDAATTALLHSPETKVRESFLSDSLTEEERRTRTRYIPAVDGMHALRKQEIKGDLALARSMQLANGASEKLARSSKRKHTEDDTSGVDAMDSSALSGEDAMMSTEEDKTAGGASTKTVDVGSMTLNVPSAAFVAPAAESNVKRSTPREVDFVVAFNPPRPPESIGAKKKHRMLRWERRPSDIEVDLSNYRKTVQKTREELKSAEGELERIRVVDNQLRRHFLQHIQCMNAEIQLIGEEIATVQQECVDMADLPSSRTRTRGAFKGTNAMKDVIHALRAKGKEIEAKGIELSMSSPKTSSVYGAGGVTSSSFVDWDRSTSIESGNLAEAWIVAGDTVKTPYGVGIVRAVYGPSVLNASERPSSELFPATSSPAIVGISTEAMDVDERESHSSSVDEATSKKKISKSSKSSDASAINVSLKSFLAPRVAVQLPFGIAFFNLCSIRSEEDVSSYTDDQLAKRWSGIAESAAQFGASINVSAMSNALSRNIKGGTILGGNHMEINESESEEANDAIRKERLLPFGAGMFPTAVGRGTLLHKAIATELDEAVEGAFFKGYGVLGTKSNMGVPNDVRKLEDQRQEHLNLKAKVLQLRNQLYRQRRIRLLNEKTYASSQERSSRVESLVAEMRLDLKNLKGRLDLEIRDFGINEEQAESILKAFYTSQDSQHSGDPSSPSRPQRIFSMSVDDVERQDSSEAPLASAETETSAAE